MGIAITLQDYLTKSGAEYEVVAHPRALTSLEVAATAHVPGDHLAKTVILEDDKGYLMAVIPSTHHVRIGMLGKQLKRNLRLASEFDLAGLFKDCELGAIPPMGKAYGLETILADDLARQSDIYFEAGDHLELIHVSGSQFLRLIGDADQRQFSRHV